MPGLYEGLLNRSGLNCAIEVGGLIRPPVTPFCPWKARGDDGAAPDHEAVGRRYPQRIRGNVMVVTLKHERRPLLPAFTAGAHVDVHLPDGRVRQYSLCNDPADRSQYQLAIKREQGGRGGSIWLHENLAQGGDGAGQCTLQPLRVVRKGGAPSASGRRIGITPILAMSHALTAANRPFEGHYFTRSRAQAPLLDDIAAMPGPAAMHHHFDDEPKTRAELADLLASPADGTHLYCCGPAGFMDLVRTRAAHWRSETLHFRGFSGDARRGFRTGILYNQSAVRAHH